MNIFWWIVLVYLLSVLIYKLLFKYICAWEVPENTIFDMQKLGDYIGYIPLVNIYCIPNMIKDCIDIYKKRRKLSKMLKDVANKMENKEAADTLRKLSKDILK